jgi:acyl carrier protein
MRADAALTEQMTELIRDVLQVEVPDSGTDLVEEGLIDSLALVSLITEMELEFGVRLPLGELDLACFRSAEQMADVVAALVPDRRAA